MEFAGQNMVRLPGDSLLASWETFFSQRGAQVSLLGSNNSGADFDNSI